MQQLILVAEIFITPLFAPKKKAVDVSGQEESKNEKNVDISVGAFTCYPYCNH